MWTGFLCQVDHLELVFTWKPFGPSAGHKPPCIYHSLCFTSMSGAARFSVHLCPRV